MQVTVRQVHTKADLKRFIFLPETLHKHHNNWLPPIYLDEWKFYDPKYNHSLSRSETVLFLALKNGKTVGRIMGIINHKYNELHKKSDARFFNFDCVDDPVVSGRLLSAVENWASEKKMNQVVGPFGFSDKDPQGLQVEGFEHLPVIATPTNQQYIKTLIEIEGYEKKVDCVSYRLDVPEKIPENYQRVYARLMQNDRLKLVEFSSTRELRPYIVPVFRLVNETYKNLFGFIPMTEAEMFQLAKQYLPILDPEFTKLVIDKNNNPVAFVIASPDISKGIQKSRGRLFPLGFIYILSSAKKSKQLDLFLGAVREDFQNSGVTSLLAVSLFNSALNRKLQSIDSHLILETNKPMRAVMEKLGAVVYKRYRIYQKSI